MINSFDINIYLNSILGKKPEKLVLLDLRKFEALADFFVVCHGKSARQVTTIAEHVKIDLKKKNIKPLSFEGFSDGNWVVLDYGRVIIHIFQLSFREKYNLEGLWSDARSFNIKNLNDFDNSDDSSFIIYE